MTEIKQKPDNSFRPLITGWRLWLWLAAREMRGCGPLGRIYSDPAFPACPECGSRNVRLTANNPNDWYMCLEKNCKASGPCKIEGSTGAERRRAIIRSRLIALVIFVVALALAQVFAVGH